MKKRVFRLLERGYFCFPLKDIGKKFKIIDTYTLYLKDKKLLDLLNQTKKYHLNFIQIYGEIFWKAIKQEKIDKKFKDCWIVPIKITEIGDELMLDIDILKPVR